MAAAFRIVKALIWEVYVFSFCGSTAEAVRRRIGRQVIEQDDSDGCGSEESVEAQGRGGCDGEFVDRIQDWAV